MPQSSSPKPHKSNGKPEQPHSIESLIDAFLTHLEVRRSVHTVKAYRSDLMTLTRFANQPSDLNEGVVRQWLRSYAMSPRTRSRKLSALKTFLKYLNDVEGICTTHLAGLDSPYQRHTLPKSLPEAEVVRVLDEDRNSKYPVRDQAVLEVLYGAGIRVSELVGLNLQDVDLGNHSLKVFGKGAKERMVIFGDTCRFALKEYMGGNRVEPVAGEPLFTGPSGCRLSVRAVQRIVKRAMSRAGSQYLASPHTMRHSFATHLLDHGADLKSVQQLLGHESLATTQVYTHVSIERLKDAVSKTHPQSKMKG